MKRFLVSVFAFLIASAIPAVAAAPPILSAEGYFFVGGHSVAVTGGKIMDGAMYVHYQIPAKRTHRYPVIMLHGANQTGTNFEGTPDGRPGWARAFLARGFAVYVVDQPARGRSAYHPDVDGKLRRSDAQFTSERWTAPEVPNKWPQAKLHTQWPGTGPRKGQPGDPIFDQFYDSQVETLADPDNAEILIRAAGAALLDKIGPSILITHSQGGALGWQIVDARPKLVKAVLAIEPSTSPAFPPAATPPAEKDLLPPYAVTQTPITYAPALTSPADLTRVPQTAPDSPDLWSCWMQAAPARTLPTLAGVTIAIVVSEASAFSQTNHCLARYLTQAGVKNDFIRLEKVGIHGNGHMMMLEKNNVQIADFLMDYLTRKKL